MNTETQELKETFGKMVNLMTDTRSPGTKPVVMVTHKDLSPVKTATHVSLTDEPLFSGDQEKDLKTFRDMYHGYKSRYGYAFSTYIVSDADIAATSPNALERLQWLFDVEIKVG